MTTWVLAAATLLDREDDSGTTLGQALAGIHNTPRSVLQGRYVVGQLMARAEHLIEQFNLTPEIVRDYKGEDLAVLAILPELFALLGDSEFSGLIVMPESMLRAIKSTPHWRLMDGGEYEGADQFNTDCATLGIEPTGDDFTTLLLDAQVQLRGAMKE